MQAPAAVCTEALEKLVAGNHRYAAMRQVHPRQTLAHRNTLVDGQHPFAVILSCSDSRVPSELIFDQGLGDLFIVRMAGHVVDDLVLASIEYAVYALEVPLVMVLGHAQCGAVASALTDKPMPGNIGQLVQHIHAAVESVRGQPGELLENAVRANSRLCAAQIMASSTVIQEAVQAGRVLVVPAFYDLSSGHVELLSE
jgi:carbonic anhydrase